MLIIFASFNSLKCKGLCEISSFRLLSPYVYSSTSGIPNLPEFMIVGLVDGEPFVHYDSNSHKMTHLQEWMAKSEGPDYWNRESQIAMGNEQVFKNNIEVAKQRFNQTGGIHTVQWMYGCDWDDETGATGALHLYGYDGRDFIALDFRTMTYWDHDRAWLNYLKSYFTQECIEWLKKYVSYGKSTLERTGTDLNFHHPAELCSVQTGTDNFFINFI
uniref:MHC class I-like antigen recognition-like domain-containing protein n=1 Tax=Paramormyrops kingsleyae TaxID=1676925 RepID=A0A3B3SGB2_9TELE